MAAVASALAMNGCVVFAPGGTTGQTGLIGSVRLTFTVCASQTSSPPPGSCANTGNSGRTAYNNTPAKPVQVFIGFRVPTGTLAPSAFSSTATGPGNTGPQLRFTPSAAYASELQRLMPAAAGQQWVGYVSQYVPYTGNSGSPTDQNFTATVDFGLPRQPNGAPFAGPFKYQAVVGGREYLAAGPPDPNEPIDCQNSLTTGWGSGNPGGGNDWVCVDDQFPATLGDDFSLATRDAGIVPGAAVTAKPGSTASVPFTFGYVGTPPGASFSLSAATTVAGASASASPGTVTPTGTSNTPVAVSVAIPKNTAPGTYPVTLTARLPDSETRSGTVLLTIQGCQVPDLKGKRLSKAKKLLKKASCRLGKKHGHGKVISQKPAAGKLLSLGSKVSVKLG